MAGTSCFRSALLGKEVVMGQIIDSLLGKLGGHLLSHPGTMFWLAVGVGLAIGVNRKVTRFGAGPVIIGIGMIVVLGWAMRYVPAMTGYFAEAAQAEAVEEEHENPLETTVLNTSNAEALRKQAGDLITRLADERRAKKEAAAKLRKAQWEIGRLTRSLGTQVGKDPTDLSEEGRKDCSYGRCPVCRGTFVMAGDKGNDRIRCPHCGGVMTALAAIQWWHRSRRGY
jgi:hypothetical protein